MLPINTLGWIVEHRIMNMRPSTRGIGTSCPASTTALTSKEGRAFCFRTLPRIYVNNSGNVLPVTQTVRFVTLADRLVAKPQYHSTRSCREALTIAVAVKQSSKLMFFYFNLFINNKL
jgi:hypothetical protein